MARYLSTIVTLGFVIVLLIVSVGLVYVTEKNVFTIETLSLQSLENTALALATAAEVSLRRSGSHVRMSRVFSDRVVAYAFITDLKGMILFHTNRSLVGSTVPAAYIARVINQKSKGRRIDLGTGTPAFEFHHVIHNNSGVEEVLWLVLHTAQADRIVTDAKRMWWSVSLLLLAIWVAGFFLRYLLIRYLAAHRELEQKSRMAMIGQMTTVLAHEIRNALGGVKGYVQWMGEKATDPDAVREGAAIVVKGAERIEQLVGDLLLFSKDEAYNITDFDLQSLIEETIPLALSGWEGTVKTELGDGRTLAKGDPDKVQRALVNALQNSVQAMGEGGTLSVVLKSRGRRVRLEIADSGPGIGKDDLPKLFTPFFTTKADGTGLGLAYSRKVMEAMGGTIDLENGREEGAVYTMTLSRVTG